MKKFLLKVRSTEAGLIMLNIATLVSLVISICNLDVKPVAIAFFFPFLAGGLYYVFAEALGKARAIPEPAIDDSTGQAAKKQAQKIVSSRPYRYFYLLLHSIIVGPMLLIVFLRWDNVSKQIGSDWATILGLLFAIIYGEAYDQTKKAWDSKRPAPLQEGA